MKEELKPQVGDIKIEKGYYSGYRVLVFEGGLTGWQDKLGYTTSDKDYAFSFVKEMSLYREDEDGHQYYRTAVSASVPPVSKTALPVANIAPVPVPTSEQSQEKIPPKISEKKPVQVGAHKRESYARTIATRLITFKCARCGQTVTQERYPSPKPMYCSDVCKKEVEKKQTRLRVQALRAKRKPSQVG